MERECTLDTNTETHFADGEGFMDSTALTADDSALEELHALTSSFDHSDVDFERVAGAELRHVVAEALGVDEVDGVH
ncbi:unannotated protein [freshwater metagenome]|uniref:Unannotated protein n=1 Tax=freshwater metagenome TaxID=449393 RepID=A0A6J7VC43_9ZZZZ